MKGRSGKVPLLVDEPAFVSDQESDNEKDNHREDSSLQHRRRQPVWKKRLGLASVLANPKKEAPTLARFNSNNSINSNSITHKNRTSNYGADRSPQHSLQSDQQSNPPERSSQHERQRSNDTINQMMELEYDDDHEDDQHDADDVDEDEENTAMFNEEDLFAGANHEDRTAPLKMTPKTTTVTFLGDHTDNPFEGVNSFPDQGLPFMDDEEHEEAFATMASQEATTSSDHQNNNDKTKTMTISRSKAMLSRPFGRSSLPQSMVKVSRVLSRKLSIS